MQIRTAIPHRMKVMLYQLSYVSINLVDSVRVELTRPLIGENNSKKIFDIILISLYTYIFNNIWGIIMTRAPFKLFLEDLMQNYTKRELYDLLPIFFKKLGFKNFGVNLVAGVKNDLNADDCTLTINVTLPDKKAPLVLTC